MFGIASVSTDLKHGELVLTVENIGKESGGSHKHRDCSVATNGRVSACRNIFPRSWRTATSPRGAKMPVRVRLANYDPVEEAKITARTTILFADGSIKYDDGFGHRHYSFFIRI